jgi:uncharacterized protein YneR
MPVAVDIFKAPMRIRIKCTTSRVGGSQDPNRGFGQDFPADTNGEVQNTDAADGLRFEITGF